MESICKLTIKALTWLHKYAAESILCNSSMASTVHQRDLDNTELQIIRKLIVQSLLQEDLVRKQGLQHNASNHKKSKGNFYQNHM